MKKVCLYFIFLLVLVFGVYFYTSYYNKDRFINDSSYYLEKQEGLPLVVENKRQAIYKAVKEKSLEKLANEAEDNFKYSFGGDVEGGFISYLQSKSENSSDQVFDIISRLLELPYGKQGIYYYWPSVFTKESKDWTEEDIAQMKTFLTDQEIESYRDFGGYASYRIGITEEGKWVYFVSGD